MSTSTITYACGEVRLLRTMCSAIARRTDVSGTIVSPSPGAAAACAAAGCAAVAGGRGRRRLSLWRRRSGHLSERACLHATRITPLHVLQHILLADAPAYAAALDLRQIHTVLAHQHADRRCHVVRRCAITVTALRGDRRISLLRDRLQLGR